MRMDVAFESVDAYLAAVPDASFRDALEHLRATIRDLAPEADESITYGIPTYKLHGKRLIYFGAAKKHLAIYGTDAGTTRFTPDTPLTRDFLKAQIDKRAAEIEAAAKPKRTKPTT